MTGFEPATPATRTQCATKLRYIPISYIFCILSTLTQFGFNWNLASVPLAKCATFRFFIFFVFHRLSRSLVLIGIGFRYTRQVRYSEFIRLAGSHQQFVQQYYTKKIKNQTNFYEKFQ